MATTRVVRHLTFLGLQTKMAEEEHTRWLDMVGAKETQLLGIRETVEQLETGLEQVRKDILPQLRTHKVPQPTSGCCLCYQWLLSL